MRLEDYELVAELHHSERALVTRQRHRTSGQTVVLKALPADRLHAGGVARLRYEHRVLRHLNAAGAWGVPEALGLIDEPGTMALVSADIHGVSLRQLTAGRPLVLLEALQVAHALAQALVHTHRAHVVHKDINPNNIVYNAETQAVQLIDFDMASLIEHELQSVDSLSALEGTLPYVSPEQTGRLSRALDYRSDFFSLGVTLYELLSGRAPFAGDEPSQVVYAILTQVPPSLNVQASSVPTAVAGIVARLLHKDPQMRYQSASGLQVDLQRCLQDLQATGHVSHFEPGSDDISERFEISQRLYGRDEATAQLQAAYSRVGAGCQAFAMVLGPSGIGKSALVNQLQAAMLVNAGQFGAGKSELLHRHQPFAALAQALTAVLRRILTEPPEMLGRWRRRLQAALGSSAQAVVDVVPELGVLLGAQKELLALGAQESENRLLNLMQGLLQALAKAQPLVLFLDDLQWADHGTLKLLQRVANEPHRGEGLLVIGAYRDNEVTETHPVHGLGKALQTEYAQAVELLVRPLQAADVAAMVRDTTRWDAAAAAPLADLLVTKTGGNPFFVHEFLKTLHAQHMIAYDPERRRWRWDMQAVQSVMVTANVADLLARELQGLPPAQREVLAWGACVGSEVPFSILALASNLEKPQLLAALQALLARSLLLPVGGAYRYADDDPDAAMYRFAHDKITQAAYELLSADARQHHHLSLGRVLHAQMDRAGGPSALQVVHHFNRALELLSDSAERVSVGTLNVAASQQACLAMAYDLALDYGQKAQGLLDGTPWATQPTLHAQLHTSLAQASALSGHPAQALPHLDALEANAQSRVEALLVARERVTLMVVARQPALARAAINAALRTLRLPLNSPPSVWQVLRAFWALGRQLLGRNFASLRRLSAQTNEVERVSELLLVSLSYASISMLDPLGYLGATFYTASVALGAGHLTAQACVGIVSLNMSLNRFAAGQGWAALLRARLPECNDPHGKITCGYMLLAQIDHLSLTAQQFMDQNEAIGERALEVGNAMDAQVIAMYGTFAQAATSLDACAVRVHQPSAVMQMMREYQPPAYDGFRLALDALQGKRDDGAFAMSHDEYRKQVPPDVPMQLTRGAFCTLQLWVAYVHRDFTTALALIDQNVKDGLFTVLANIATVLMGMVAVLIITQSGVRKPTWWPLARGRIRKSAAAGPTYRGLGLFLEAELAAQRGRFTRAHALYDAAITALLPSGYTMFVAMALENAGRLHARTQVHSSAAPLLARARETYRAWGAAYKVRQLDQEFAAYGLRRTLQGGTVSSKGSERLEQHTMDLPAILAATQALTAEVVHEKLIAKILLALEQSTGATRSALLLRADDDLQLAADSRGEGAPLPRDLLRYVVRSEQPVMVDALERNLEFKEALTTLGVKAMLCVPVKQHGTVLGVIYLESAVASGVFGPERMLLVSVLASQAAIALENARLYGQQEGLVAQRTHELRAAHARLLQLERASTESQMAGGFAHEMRNALAGAAYAMEAMAGVPQALEAVSQQHAQALGPAATQLQQDAISVGHTLEVVQGAIGRAMEITSKILAYAQVGELHVGDDSTVLADVLQRVLQGAQGSLSKHPVRMQLEVDPTLRLPMRADHVETLLQNLLANAMDAVKSQDETDRKLSIVATRSGQRVQVMVADSGAGIDGAHVGRIFQPFFSTKGAHGAGLGLALCKKIVQAYGGQIAFAPAQPHGTAFTIEVDWPQA